MAEVTGLVLGAFPLMISAMEHYRKCAEVYGDWWKYKKHFQKCKRAIEREKLRFDENLEELLGPIVQDERQLQHLLDEPGSADWKAPDLEEKLHERLPKSYDAYMDIITELQDVTENLKRELQLDGLNLDQLMDDSPATSQKFRSMLDFQRRRIKFGFGGSTRKRLLSEMEKHNADLRSLLATSTRLAPDRNRRKSKALITTFQQIWRHANSLFSLLTKAWPCNCKELHHANLLLRHHLKTVSAIDFNVVFMFSQDRAPCAWKWKETNITIIESPDPPLIAQKCTPADQRTGIPPRSLTTAPSRPLPSILVSEDRTGHPLRIKSAPFPTSKPPASVGFVDPRPPTPPTDADSTSMTEITNLCATLSRPGPCATIVHSPPCFGFMKEEEHRYIIHPVTATPSLSDPRDAVTLEKLLTDSCLSRRERYFIALTLASSHLQLHSSPWIAFQWSTADILFHDTETGGLQKPYLSRRVIPSSSKEGNHADTTSQLGIILLELCFNMTLGTYSARKGLQTDPVVTAMQWCVEEAPDEAGPEFADAIEWCLRQGGRRRGCGFSEQQWKEELLEKVVEPLGCCYKSLARDLDSI